MANFLREVSSSSEAECGHNLVVVYSRLSNTMLG